MNNKKTIFLIICMLILWLIFPFILKNIISTEIEVLGQFGDQFGALNALFSGVVIILLISDLYLTRKELIESREELKKQTKQAITANLNAVAQLKMEMLKARLESAKIPPDSMNSRNVTKAIDIVVVEMEQLLLDIAENKID